MVKICVNTNLITFFVELCFLFLVISIINDELSEFVKIKNIRKKCLYKGMKEFEDDKICCNYSLHLK